MRIPRSIAGATSVPPAPLPTLAPPLSLLPRSYLKFAKDVEAYCTELYSTWKESSVETAVGGLACFIIASATGDNTPVEGSCLPARPYKCNFSPGLVMLTDESKLLEQMGFEVPEEVLNVALQKKRYLAFRERIELMIADYDAAIDSLSQVEVELLRAQVEDLRRELKPGFDPLNWNSLSIDQFIDGCNKAIKTFEQVRVHQHFARSSTSSHPRPGARPSEMASSLRIPRPTPSRSCLRKSRSPRLSSTM